jgi:hypothetical protein
MNLEQRAISHSGSIVVVVFVGVNQLSRFEMATKIFAGEPPFSMKGGNLIGPDRKEVQSTRLLHRIHTPVDKETRRRRR